MHPKRSGDIVLLVGNDLFLETTMQFYKLFVLQTFAHREVRFSNYAQTIFTCSWRPSLCLLVSYQQSCNIYRHNHTAYLAIIDGVESCLEQ